MGTRRFRGTIDIDTLKVGGTTVSNSAANLNSAPVTVERTFTETTGAGTYTATVAVPAGATILNVVWRNTAVWTAATSATLNVGDDDDSDGFFTVVNVKSAPVADTVGAGGISSFKNDTGSGAYGGLTKYCAAAKTVTASVVTVGSSGNAGRSRLIVSYALPQTAAATKA